MSWKKKFVRNWGRLGMKFNWTTKKLSEIAYINPRESIGKGVVAKKVPMDKLQPFCRDVPEFVLGEYKGGTKFRNDDTIMARITPCLENGKIAKVSVLNTDEIGFGSTEYIVFRAIDGVSDADFLYYLISSPLVRNPAIKSMVGSSGRQRVQTDVVANLDIELPPIEEQRKIGGLLKTFDDKIKLNNEINNNLEQQIEMVLLKTINDTDTQPVMLGDYLYIKGRIGWKGLKKSEYLPISNYRIINGESLTLSGIDWNKAGYISAERYEESPEIMLNIGDILLSKDGTIGKIGYVDKLDAPTSVASGIFVIRNTRQSEISTQFIYYLLKSKLFKAFIASRTEGSVIPHLYQKDFMEFEFQLPSPDDMKIFDDTTADMFSLVFSNLNENERLIHLRDSLLPKLMSGELDVSDTDI